MVAKWSKVLPLNVSYLLPLGPAMVAKWSKALPLTACCPSLLPKFELWLACENIASDLVLGSVFDRFVVQSCVPLATG